MAAIMSVNPKAELARAAAALEVNISGARGLEEVMRSNLGPKGTLKMLVSGAGDIKLTKDGNVLLKEMQIQHPTASLIARASTAQDDIIGDGTTSTVLLIGELLKQANNFIMEGVHPRVLVEGIELAKKKALEVLDKISITKKMDRETLLNVARTSLRTKVKQELADHLTECIVDAVLTIYEEGKPLDLFMIEIMEMTQKTDMDTTFVKGIVLDHGARHPDMKKNVTNAFILTCNAGLEYEKTEVNSGFFYKSAGEREKLVAAERQYVDERVAKIIALKRKVCDEETAKDGKERGFVVINQKGIDPPSLDKLAKAGIMALRRAKRRNMERLTKACGGVAVNSVEDLTPDVLGYAGSVYEHTLGEDKFTFVEDCKDPKSVTLLIKGPNKHTITQIKDAIHDGLHAVKNALDDGKVVPGAAAFEIAVYMELLDLKRHTRGRSSLGIQAFADAVLIVPKVLAQNAGFDPMETILKLQAEATRAEQTIGLDISTGEALVPAEAGIWDNFVVKKQQMDTFVGIGTNLLLVDEVMRAGMSSLKG